MCLCGRGSLWQPPGLMRPDDIITILSLCSFLSHHHCCSVCFWGPALYSKTPPHFSPPPGYSFTWTLLSVLSHFNTRPVSFVFHLPTLDLLLSFHHVVLPFLHSPPRYHTSPFCLLMCPLDLNASYFFFQCHCRLNGYHIHLKKDILMTENVQLFLNETVLPRGESLRHPVSWWTFSAAFCLIRGGLEEVEGPPGSLMKGTMEASTGICNISTKICPGL